MNPPLFAVDTNFLMDLAHPRDVAHDALDIIRKRVPRAFVLATERALAELNRFATTPALGKQALAQKAQELMFERGIQPTLLTDVQASIADIIAGKLLDHRLLPWEEQNDAVILAEAAALGCDVLISSDSHLRDIDRTRLEAVMQASGVPVVITRKPEDIVRMFAGRR